MTAKVIEKRMKDTNSIVVVGDRYESMEVAASLIRQFGKEKKVHLLLC